MKTDNISVYHNLVNHHFELQVEEQAAFIDYDEHSGTLELTYLHIPERLLGKGILHILADKLMQYIREQKYRFSPVDTVLRRYFELHPEYGDLLIRS